MARTRARSTTSGVEGERSQQEEHRESLPYQHEEEARHFASEHNRSPTPPHTNEPTREELNMLRMARAIVTAISETSRSDKGPTIERARSLGAVSFAGTTDPVEAKSWLLKMEKIFAHMKCDDESKLHFATFLLEKGAASWWDAMKRQWDESVPISWATFRKAFFQQYYPVTYREMKRREFMKLYQGSMTVAEYEEKFTHLSQFAPEMVATEYNKCIKFEEGLNNSIKVFVSANCWREYGKLLESAMRVESNILESRKRKDNKRKMQQDGSYSSPFPGPSKRTNSSFQQHENRRTPPTSQGSVAFPTKPGPSQGSVRDSANNTFGGSTCQTCGRRHRGDCWTCFECGQKGHLRNKCPTLMQSHVAGQKLSNSGQRPNVQPQTVDANRPNVRASTQTRSQARVFAMTQADAETNQDVIEDVNAGNEASEYVA